MTITKRNYLLHTALLTVLIGSVGGWAYFSINPHHSFGGYPLIPMNVADLSADACDENAGLHDCDAGLLRCST